MLSAANAARPKGREDGRERPEKDRINDNPPDRAIPGRNPAGNAKDEVIDKFDRAIGPTEDNLQRKLQFLGEGHQMLAEKLEETRTELKAEFKVDHRMTGVAADLVAHRADTAVHRGYQVREN